MPLKKCLGEEEPWGQVWVARTPFSESQTLTKPCGGRIPGGFLCKWQVCEFYIAAVGVAPQGFIPTAPVCAPLCFGPKTCFLFKSKLSPGKNLQVILIQPHRLFPGLLALREIGMQTAGTRPGTGN